VCEREREREREREIYDSVCDCICVRESRVCDKEERGRDHMPVFEEQLSPPVSESTGKRKGSGVRRLVPY
jgi:hypothetical protein